MAAQIEREDADRVPQPREQGASLEQQIVAVLAEPVQQDDGQGGVGRAVLLEVQPHSVVCSHIAGPGRLGRGETGSLAHRRPALAADSAVCDDGGANGCRGGSSRCGDDAALHEDCPT